LFVDGFLIVGEDDTTIGDGDMVVEGDLIVAGRLISG
jgi:hypothetical protein